MAMRVDDDLRPQTLKIVLVGDAKSGKDQLINRYIKNEFSDVYVDTTIAAVFQKTIAICRQPNDSSNVLLFCWSIAGASSSSYISTFTRADRSLVIMIICDLTQPDDELRIQQYRGLIADKDAGVILVGTKMDAVPTVHRTEREQKFRAFAAHFLPLHPCVITSAKTGEGVEVAFKRAVQMGLKIEEPVGDLKRQNAIDCSSVVQGNKSRQNLLEALGHYRRRIESYQFQGKTDFRHGFRFFKQSQAKNRKANYCLAETLITKLNQTQPVLKINDIFDKENINALRKQFKLTGGIHSDDLNYIIKCARKGTEVQLEKLQKTNRSGYTS